MEKDQKKPLKSFSLRVNKNARIDLHLKEGLFEKSNHASFITISIYKEGSQMPIPMAGVVWLSPNSSRCEKIRLPRRESGAQ